MQRFWMFKFPGEVYAYGPVEASSEKEARVEIRRVWGLERLPKGTEIWETRGSANPVDDELEFALKQKAKGATAVLVLPPELGMPLYGGAVEVAQIHREVYPQGRIWAIDRWIEHLEEE